MIEEDKYLNFLGKNSPKIIIIILIFQLIMFIIDFWQHKVYEFIFISLSISINLFIWNYLWRNQK